MKWLVVSAVLLLSPPAWGYEFSGTDWTHEVSPVQEPWVLNASSFPAYMGGAAVLEGRLVEGMNGWTDSGAAVSFSYGGLTAEAGTVLGDGHVISFNSTSNPNNALGLNSAWSDGMGSTFECDVEFFWADAFGPITWSTSFVSTAPGMFDFQSVATHEFGHCAGLGHSGIDGTVMQPTLATGEAVWALTGDDVAGAIDLYGALCDDLDGDGWAPDVRCPTAPGPDCEDTDAAVNPDAVEVCDGVDNDCDGLTDIEDGDLFGATAWGWDIDGDGVPGTDFTTNDCNWPGEGWFALDGGVDCDDQDTSVFPGQIESCDGIDEDCSGGTGSDEADVDGDLWLACEDCDDGDPLVQPQQVETCDGIDNDCDGLVDGADPDSSGGGSWFVDGDGDGVGTFPMETSCDGPPGYVTLSGDCNDGDPDISPLADEVCDGIDNNCNFKVDDWDADLTGAPLWFGDLDGDGFGEEPGVPRCANPPGTIATGGDCDDGDNGVFPGALEACDGVDTDCDGALMEGEEDNDADGSMLCEGDCDDFDPEEFPGNVEDTEDECSDNLDQDCDGQLDENDEDCWPALGLDGGGGDDDDSGDEPGDDDDSIGDTDDDDAGDDDDDEPEGEANDDDATDTVPPGGDTGELNLPEDWGLSTDLYPAWGCGCTTGGDGAGAGATWLLLLLAARRRRGSIGSWVK